MIETRVVDGLPQANRKLDMRPALPVAQAVLAGNLAVVERAIAESRSAVESAPGSGVARDRLRAGLARKLALLRTSAALELEPRGVGARRP